MKVKVYLLLFALLALIITGCGVTPGSEPAASDDPPAGVEGEPTTDPDQPVSSNDPTPTAVPTPTAEPTADAGEIVIDEAKVTDIQIMMLESFPVQVRVQVMGELGDGCTELGAITSERQGDTFFVTVNRERPAEAICTQQLKFFEETVDLDVVGLEAGTYTVNVNGVTDTFTLPTDNKLPDEDTDTAELPPEDLAQLIRLTLERALIEQEIPDYQLLVQDRDEIVLSSENIEADLPELAGVNLVLLTPAEIQTRANEEGDFPYLQFQEITAESATNATVSLGSTWARAEDSDMLYLSGGGFTIEYTKEGGQWSGEIVTTWIS